MPWVPWSAWWIQPRVWLGSPPPDRHVQRVSDQFGAEVIGDRPTDHPPGPRIDDRCQEHVAFLAPMLGYVSIPQPVRSIDGELTIDQLLIGEARYVSGETGEPHSPVCRQGEATASARTQFPAAQGVQSATGGAGTFPAISHFLPPLRLARLRVGIAQNRQGDQHYFQNSSDLR